MEEDTLVPFKLPDGTKKVTRCDSNTTAKLFKDLCLEELNFQSDDFGTLAVCVTGDSIVCPLEPSESVVKILDDWKSFAKSLYITANVRTVPQVVLRRSPFCCRDTESRWAGTPINHILFLDAMAHFRAGRYAFNPRETIGMIATLVQLYSGNFDARKSKLQEYKHLVNEMTPSGFSSSEIENEVLQRHKVLNGMPGSALMHQFLTKCRELPWYGAAFFNVQRPEETPPRATIAVNPEGLFVISSTTIQVSWADVTDWASGEGSLHAVLKLPAGGPKVRGEAPKKKSMEVKWLTPASEILARIIDRLSRIALRLEAAKKGTNDSTKPSPVHQVEATPSATQSPQKMPSYPVGATSKPSNSPVEFTTLPLTHPNWVSPHKPAMGHSEDIVTMVRRLVDLSKVIL